MGRRWGKTVLGGCVALATASQGGAVAWVVPTYKNGRPLWRWAERTAAPVRKAGQASINRSERTIEFAGGGFLGIYSMDNEDSIRGESFHLVIVDEAAKIAESAWTDAIQPTLADHNADAILISTPRGRNWFWQEWLRGKDSDTEAASFHAPSRDNPNENIRRAAELAKERVPERTYRQEWLAEFVDDGNGVFRRVSEAATATKQDRAQHGHQYVIGIDWGKLTDFTVLSVIDLTTMEQVYLDRFNQIDYSVQMGRLEAVVEKFKPTSILAERNSIGEPLLEQCQRRGWPIRPFVTTNTTKAEVIDGLGLSFERGTLRILNDAVQIGELQAYEATRLPSGLLRYSAPDGLHDDTVMALALSNHAATAGANSAFAVKMKY